MQRHSLDVVFLLLLFGEELDVGALDRHAAARTEHFLCRQRHAVVTTWHDRLDKLVHISNWNIMMLYRAVIACYLLRHCCCMACRTRRAVTWRASYFCFSCLEFGDIPLGSNMGWFGGMIRAPGANIDARVAASRAAYASTNFLLPSFRNARNSASNNSRTWRQKISDVMIVTTHQATTLQQNNIQIMTSEQYLDNATEVIASI